MVLQFATRVPGLFIIIACLPFTILSLLLTLIGSGVAGVRGGSLAATYQAGHYTYGSGGVASGSMFAKLQSAGATAGSVPAIPPLGLIDLVIFIIQLILFLWGIFILYRHVIGF
ncbi:hypothetical protein BDY19DRAFT_136856 [Irpex rosettiformis]|uniref:Uncharacterized protein n=1 Tax=Irpex rosettiformis TaxID=378272 RepID=A0ACB8U4R8_9APHY|nr:hypothetical protein BDY19DRAFT_136856 [Irpex rosettiformis]